jgi:hypothetical protein
MTRGEEASLLALTLGRVLLVSFHTFLGGGEGGGVHLSQQKVRYGPPHVAAHGTPTKRPFTERPVTKRPVTKRTITKRPVTGGLLIWTFENWMFCNWTFSNWTFCGWPRVADPILNRILEVRIYTDCGYEENQKKF